MKITWERKVDEIRKQQGNLSSILSESQNTHYVRVEGGLNLQSSPALRSVLRNVIQQKPEKLIVDLDGVDSMDTSGVATLLEYYQQSRTFRGGVILCNLKESVRALFEMTRVNEILPIFPEKPLSSVGARA
ncbi:MAG: STAS domain-containing protein [Verrucomicrobiota bacterium]